MALFLNWSYNPPALSLGLFAAGPPVTSIIYLQRVNDGPPMGNSGIQSNILKLTPMVVKRSILWGVHGVISQKILRFERDYGTSSVHGFHGPLFSGEVTLPEPQSPVAL